MTKIFVFFYIIIVKIQRRYVIDENLSIIGEVRQHMIKKEMIAMLLAGGQGSRLGVLTDKVAKPAVAFGGKYRIIDFPLSNCINSGIDTVGVLTQYQPLRLNSHIGIGIPWDLDKGEGGVTLLSPYESNYGNGWYSGTADAIYQNITFMDKYDPDYVVILSQTIDMHCTISVYIYSCFW